MDPKISPQQIRGFLLHPLLRLRQYPTETPSGGSGTRGDGWFPGGQATKGPVADSRAVDKWIHWPRGRVAGRGEETGAVLRNSPAPMQLLWGRKLNAI